MTKSVSFVPCTCLNPNTDVTEPVCGDSFRVVVWEYVCVRTSCWPDIILCHTSSCWVASDISISRIKWPNLIEFCRRPCNITKMKKDVAQMSVRAVGNGVTNTPRSSVCGSVPNTKLLVRVEFKMSRYLHVGLYILKICNFYKDYYWYNGPLHLQGFCFDLNLEVDFLFCF